MAISPEAKGAAGPPPTSAAASSPKGAAAATTTTNDTQRGGAPLASSPSFIAITRPKVPKLTREGYYMVRARVSSPRRRVTAHVPANPHVHTQREIQRAALPVLVGDGCNRIPAPQKQKKT